MLKEKGPAALAQDFQMAAVRRREREMSTPAPLLPRIQQRRPVAQSASDQYKGYLPREDEVAAKETISNLNREKLWQDYISCRKPVVIDGLIQDEGWHGEDWRDPNYLRKIAGSALVKIEPVDAVSDQFGTNAKRKTVLLSQFLDMLEDPELAGKWYMTTQYEEEEDDEEEDTDDDDDDAEDDTGAEEESTSIGSVNGSMTDIKIDEKLLPKVDVDVSLPAPTESLAHLFPLPGPEIMGDLVLQQCNLWLGNGKSGKSSGLHHDFHDNLYLLLSGRKRFLIWPPLAHRWLEPVGRVDTVHSNGLIEYEVPGELPLQGDGLTRRESASWLLRARLRALLEADERAARQIGEEHICKGLRKGKGKQTAEQEAALAKLREAEVDLLLMQMDDEEDEEGSEFLSTMSSEDTFSDLFDKDLISSELDEDTTDEKTKESDDYDENSMPESSDIESHQVIDRRKGKREQSFEEESQTKKQKRSSNKLIIPKGHLPGGLRGSLQDLEGDLDSESEEFADENEDAEPFLVLPLEGDPQDEQDAMLMTMEMRNRVLARMRNMAEGNFDGEDQEGISVDEESDEIEEEDDADDEDDDIDSKLDYDDDSIDSARLLSMYIKENEKNRSSRESHDDSWPELDADALEEGEAALEELARLQNEKEGMMKRLEHLEGKGNDDALAFKQADDDPKSFSKISPRVVQWYFGKAFDPNINVPPRLEPLPNNGVHLLPRADCPAPMEIHLQAGQMLYLPASWYHEVTSYSDPDDKTGLHMALNYWFHPPTAIKRPLQQPIQARGGSKSKASHSDSTQPYLNKEVWDEIRKSVNKKVDTIRRRAAAQQSSID